MFDEFKKFILRGNVVDLAVGIVIGAAFGKIVSSLVRDILMPPIGMIMGNVDFSELFINLGGFAYPSLAAAKQAGAATLNYGVFINTLVDFMIIAGAIFMLVRLIHHLQKKEAAAPAQPSTQDKLLTEIRDLLKAKA